MGAAGAGFDCRARCPAVHADCFSIEDVFGTNDPIVSNGCILLAAAAAVVVAGGGGDSLPGTADAGG